jgi:site-specific DNA-methyltransferase (adenine-specific)
MENKILLGDCLELMKDIPDGSVDMILCDLPYGTTACKWDTIIPFDKLWEQYERIVKPNGAIVLTASQPFTSALVMSNPKLFKYEAIWEKPNPSNFTFAKKGIMKFHESILIFYKNVPTYNPQMWIGEKNHSSIQGKRKINNESGANLKIVPKNTSNIKYPKSVIKINREMGLHPTQKPVALFEWLIKTYTNEGETVLDNCSGSGTTAIACLNTNRQFIVMEKEQKYFDVIKQRVNKFYSDKQQMLF